MKKPTLQKILLDFDPHPQNLLPLLKAVNKEFGHISQNHIYQIAEYFSLKPAKVFSQLSFFEELRHKPKPSLEIRICMSAPCQMKGSLEVLKEIERYTGKRADIDKSSIIEFNSASCQGRCDLGPLVIVNGTPYEKVSSNMVDDILRPYFYN